MGPASRKFNPPCWRPRYPEPARRAVEPAPVRYNL